MDDDCQGILGGVEICLGLRESLMLYSRRTSIGDACEAGMGCEGQTLSLQCIISLSLSLIGLMRQKSWRLSQPDADVSAPHYPARPSLPKRLACGCCFVCESS